MSNYQIRQLSFSEQGVQKMIEQLVRRYRIKASVALGIMSIEENNYRAGELLGCSAFAVSVMRKHMTEVLRLLLPRNYYRHIMGHPTKEVLQLQRAQVMELMERRN